MIYLYIPDGLATQYNKWVRPMVFLSLAVATFMLLGRDERPVANRGIANRIAISSVILYGIVFVGAIMLLGGAYNIATPSFSVVYWKIWTTGTSFLSLEIIRFKLIRNADKSIQPAIVTILTIAYTFVNLTVLRGMILDENNFQISYFHP